MGFSWVETCALGPSPVGTHGAKTSTHYACANVFDQTFGNELQHTKPHLDSNNKVHVWEVKKTHV